MTKKKELMSIGETADTLRVSIDTLRRWDQSGKLKSIKSEGGHRRYYRSEIELFLNDLYALAKDWTKNNIQIPEQFYCANSAVFQARLIKLQDSFIEVKELKATFPLIVAIAGEIGNNSFDHNLGNWPDTPGIFFGYDIYKRIIVLADRGVGILATLKRVKPTLDSDEDAIRVAFTEIISGRAPESRGNGLKFVRQVISQNPIGLLFQSGRAELVLAKESDDLDIRTIASAFHGCLGLITF